MRDTSIKLMTQRIFDKNQPLMTSNNTGECPLMGFWLCGLTFFGEGQQVFLQSIHIVNTSGFEADAATEVRQQPQIACTRMSVAMLQ